MLTFVLEHFWECTHIEVHLLPVRDLGRSSRSAERSSDSTSGCPKRDRMEKTHSPELWLLLWDSASPWRRDRERERERKSETPNLGWRLKAQFTKNLAALVTFSNPHNGSGVSQRETVPASADTAEACGGHVLQCKKTKKEKKMKTEENNKMSSSCLCDIIIIKCVEDAAVQFVLKR